MKWKRPSGTEIKTLEDDVTVAQCKAMGWKPVKEDKKITTKDDSVNAPAAPGTTGGVKEPVQK